jgi:hypothetical protein
MSPRSPLARIALLAAAALTFAACGTPRGAAPGEAATFAPEAEIPQLQGIAAGGAGGGAASVLGEEEVQVGEATPPGLRIAHFQIAPITPMLRDAIGFSGFQSGGTSALIELPVFGVNERQKIYFLVVPVINDGDQPVRNLKGRADFFDAEGRLIWSEIQALTHFPTRLALNPPSLPDQVDPQPELGPELANYPLYFFPTNVGLFTFSVPDASVAQKVRSWKLTFLVSTT